jgi:NADH-quinone oxidoreductase subunit F
LFEPLKPSINFNFQSISNMNQTKIISHLWGKVNPLFIESYQAHQGYEIFNQCLKGQLKPAAILKIIQESGLRGRGGAGFSTGEKWRIAFEASRQSKKSPIFIVNADESQPGTFKDRLMVERNPHQVLEGALLAAATLGAKTVYIYINGKHWEALKIMRNAIKQAEEKILKPDSRKSSSRKAPSQIKVVQGAGGYLYGEESTLINSLAGRRGEPRLRPPFPAQKGLFGRATVVNNVETVANIVPILALGVKKYRKSGTRKSPGTKLFSVTGAVKNPDVYELPLGVTVKEVIDTAGGLEKGKKIEWVRAGGSGRLLGPRELDRRLTYACGPKEASAGLGNIFVLDKETPIEDIILSFAQFYARESCGKCTPCREGNHQLLQIAKRLKQGKLLEKDWENMRALVEVLEKTSFCRLGRFSADIWREFIRKYRALFFKSRKPLV